MSVNCGYEEDEDIIEPGDRAQFAKEKAPFVTAPEFKKEYVGFDFRFLHRFYTLHRLLFLRIFSVSSGLFLFLLGLVLLKEFVVYHVGLIASGFYVALGGKDLHAFWIQTRKALLLILAVSFVNSTVEYVKKILTVTFRKLLCQAAHTLYFDDIRFYQLNVLDKAIDNPDQRMTQDIDKFCSTYCDVLPKIIVSPFTIAYYCYQGYQRSGWQGPVGCFGFFLVSTILNKLLMSPIVRYVMKQEKCEGDFRFLHMLIRVNSESIAFHSANLSEANKVEESMEKLMSTQRSLYLRQYFLIFSNNLIDYIGSIFSYMMLAIPIFSGQYDNLDPLELSSLISQNAFVLIYLIFTFTNLLAIAEPVTDVAGVTHRLGQLFERLHALENYWEKEHDKSDNHGTPSKAFNLYQHWVNKRKQIASLSVNGKKENGGGENRENVPSLPVWTLENVSIISPAGFEPLIDKLNLEFVVGQSVVITGASSAGKSSILRVLRGLWPIAEGNLKKHYPPGPHGVYFSPQKTYLTWGTLRDQISFPLESIQSTKEDKLILHYMDKLGLTHILHRVGGLDVHCNWSVFDNLSPGEMQRFCALRIFYHQPVVAVLDEVTSALPLDIEEFIYTELKRLEITLISVSHRESIRQYHHMQLHLGPHAPSTFHPVL